MRGNTRCVESKGEDPCGQGQTQTKHEWDGMSDGDDRDRRQMAGNDTNDCQALAGGDISKYRALIARISFLSQDRPDPKFEAMQACCAMAKASVRDRECVKRIGRYIAGKPRASAGSAGSGVANWKRIQTLIGEATKQLDDRCQP